MIAALLDHLWQSTVFAAVIAMLTLLVRRQAARLRFALWLTASLKFLVPFSFLVSLGRWLLPPVLVPVQVLAAFKPAALPFSAGPISAEAAPVLMTSELLLTVWSAGFVFVIGRTLWHLYEMHLLLRDAVDLDIPAPVPVKSAASFLEPGLIGIFNPVILLPQGLARDLTHEELDAVLAHELSHLGRRDNLAAALHMLVETIFWFHPLVWWISRRLIEERERACDENVLSRGTAPLVYAQSILKVCRYYVQTPLACVPGMSGPDLNVRLTSIMRGCASDELPPSAGLLLAAAGAATLMLPIAAGMLGTLPVTPIAARMEQVLHAALPLPATIPASIARPPRHVVHRRVVAPTVKTAVPLMPAMTVMVPPPATAQGGVTLTVIDPTLPALPRPEAQKDETICRRPQLLPGSRLAGPTICKLKSQWTVLKAQGVDVAPDGRLYTLGDYEKTRSLETRLFCASSTPGTSNAITFTPTCL